MEGIAIPHRLRFFVVRPEVSTQTPTGAPHKQLGPIVPLIPADELPEWLEVVGAPSELTMEQATTLTNLGTVAKNIVPWEIRIAPDAPQQQQQSWADDVPGTPPPAVHPADKMKAHWTEPQRPGGLKTSIHNRPVDGNPGTGTTDNTPPPSPPTVVPVPVPHHPAPAPAPTSHTIDPVPVSRHLASPQDGLKKSIYNCPADGNPGTDTTYNTPPPSPPTVVPVPVTHYLAPAPASDTIDPVPVPRLLASPQDLKSDDYCRHWCHHGNCKWGKQCKFQHSMPTTAQGLLDVGLREVPAWYLVTYYQHQPPRAQQQHQPHQLSNYSPLAAPAASLAVKRRPGWLSPRPPRVSVPIRNNNNNSLGGMGMGMGMNKGMGYPPHCQHQQHQQEQHQPFHGTFPPGQPFHGKFPPGLLDDLLAEQATSYKTLKRYYREFILHLKQRKIIEGPTQQILDWLLQQRNGGLMMRGGGVEEDEGKQQREGVMAGQGERGNVERVVAEGQGAAGAVGVKSEAVPAEEVNLLEL